MKKTSMIITIIIGIFTFVGGLWVFDKSYTRAERTDKIEIQLVRAEQKIERKILEDEARDLRRRMWDLERYYTPDKAKGLREYQELDNEREEILRRLKGGIK